LQLLAATALQSAPANTSHIGTNLPHRCNPVGLTPGAQRLDLGYLKEALRPSAEKKLHASAQKRLLAGTPTLLAGTA
jgi:hypothetical protein